MCYCLIMNNDIHIHIYRPRPPTYNISWLILHCTKLVIWDVPDAMVFIDK